MRSAGGTASSAPPSAPFRSIGQRMQESNSTSTFYSNSSNRGSYGGGNLDTRGGNGYQSRDGGYGGGSSRGRSLRTETYPLKRNFTLERILFGAEDRQNSGINFDKYENIPVDCSGSNLPEPIQSVRHSLSFQLLITFSLTRTD